MLELINEGKLPTEQVPKIYHAIIPGEKIPGDWYNGVIPFNIIVGEHSMTDSSFCFKHFFSTLKTGMRIGTYVTLWRTAISTEHHGYIEIGDYSFISNASIVCSDHVKIGSRVFIAGGVTIADSDFHPLDPAARIADTIALSPIGDSSRRPFVAARPIIIEDDVWIGYNATILKGVTIGAGSVIEPLALVRENVPPGSIMIGNPAKPVLK